MNEEIKRPQVAVGALVIDQNKVLLVKRGKAPARGLWAIPGGRVMWGETLEQAVKREVLEETNIPIQTQEIIYTFDSITHDTVDKVTYHYVILDFLAYPVTSSLVPQAGDDAEEARWLSLADLRHLPVSESTLYLIQTIAVQRNLIEETS